MCLKCFSSSFRLTLFIGSDLRLRKNMVKLKEREKSMSLWSGESDWWYHSSSVFSRLSAEIERIYFCMRNIWSLWSYLVWPQIFISIKTMKAFKSILLFLQSFYSINFNSIWRSTQSNSGSCVALFSHYKVKKKIRGGQYEEKNVCDWA